MKKIIALTASIVMFTASFAGATTVTSKGAITATGTSIYGDITGPAAQAGTATLIGKLSKGVAMGAAYDAGGYSIATKHDSGNTDYGTAFDATAIYKKDVGGDALTSPQSIGSGAFSTGWSAM